MTFEDLEKKLADTADDLAELKEVYYRTHYVDKDVFANPVYFTGRFVVIPKIAGAPSGVPATGNNSMVYDTTNNKLYIYNGAWKSVTFA